MTRNDLINAVWHTTPLTRKQSIEAVLAIIHQIKSTLAEHETIRLRGLGEFSVKHKKKRGGRNPKTGEPATISSRFVCRFKASKTLKGIVNNNGGGI